MNTFCTMFGMVGFAIGASLLHPDNHMTYWQHAAVLLYIFGGMILGNRYYLMAIAFIATGAGIDYSHGAHINADYALSLLLILASGISVYAIPEILRKDSRVEAMKFLNGYAYATEALGKSPTQDTLEYLEEQYINPIEMSAFDQGMREACFQFEISQWKRESEDGPVVV